ncbi:MAG: Type IV fimbrial assembly, ATPase PilB [Candidatus Falkowbacteria bacterium GW2011_GWC2_38_22]|uniref:Type IV fimbrial assembly, ATPase PilB n=1 Tax=Candidatus Falkowbacteria bacterium GW2011_GWE1_38_31 TaxID=1618638 RepID=A0A0G0M8L7_9BACT|nr:MAG: Type IV fimbrial assembly, ATPase PilB [Candidatus Falkowbacteria bacterium GW2011_GWF2_38_1205]KKQ61202.1 MAG: Type IV fimbrial assembly, ATPase PilB [Candidatus Falkowbacteria bacterium GW2011_GWC2_38_22]KKQ63292.1 MAG: Type IV fimbrial assembly, ATPase PilB [Candidatus Falkowbacteria bacterium GW2011_GWF1_38_22]KKQ65590.1 MAG: Type IV fimbrial assembly, ATPase PilB [Candidatus Falkowbacteria bacterium GW2011_GWE2_38_254]KKQ70024.1 MAG: Type IV fimbrial assembly, ATPase PilB [Candidat
MSLKSKNEDNKVDIIKLVNDIFYQGIKEGVSDIHIQPYKGGIIVRYRIDGILHSVFEGDKTLNEFMLSRIKILADLETTGLPRPQEGNIKFPFENGFVDLRVSIFPTSQGETVVVRVLESKKFFNDYKDLGFNSEQITDLEKIIKKPYGLILVTGPNGSGKSTTLFTILNKLNVPEKSLVTLEDPVERKIELVRQTNIDPSIGLTFAEGLRYLLRQDPDVLMVGEIRDKETANIAVQAAVTGHLVLATIHTNNAAGAIVRLINMGIEPFLLSSALKFVSAQRLSRLNCPHCKEEYIPPKDLIEALDAPSGIKFYHSIGCDKCNGKGMKGRLGIHEVLIVTKPIQELILQRPSDDHINDLAIKEGMTSLRQAALQNVYSGNISIEEALRLTE